MELALTNIFFMYCSLVQSNFLFISSTLSR